jgi:ABC-type transport system involved in cytochrome c biogenesis permease subunit
MSSLGGAFLVFLFFLLSQVFRSQASLMERAGTITNAVTFLLILFSLVARGFFVSRFPCSNLYESLVIFALSVSGLAFYFIFRNKWNFLGWPSALLTIFLLVYAVWLPSTQKDAIPLIPALDSYWRAIHVPALIVSYGFLSLSGIITLFGLFNLKNTELLDKFLNAVYSCVALGFPLLTFGIVTGALWANHSWGNLWQWDPKENLALVTWLIYGAYLHFKLSGKAKQPVLIAISLLGLISIYFTYLGINHFDMGGLHTYGKV